MDRPDRRVSSRALCQTPSTELLPLLPLTHGVVLPGMVVTITLESDEAKRAARRGRSRRRPARPGAPDRRTLRHRRHHHQDRERRRAAQRRRRPSSSAASAAPASAAACPGAEGALHVQVEPVDEPEPDARVRELAREYRVVDRERARAPRRAPHRRRARRASTSPAQLADTAAYSPDLTMEQRVELLETIDVEARLELAIAWAREVLADLELKDKIRNEVERRPRQAAARDVAAPPDGRDPQGARRERRRRGRGVPHQARRARTCPTPCATRSTRSSTGSSAWGSRAPSTRGSATGSTRCSTCRGATYADEHSDLGEARAVLDADHEGLDKVKERILEFLAVRVLRTRARPRQRQRTRFGRDPRARRPSGCRQDVARRVGGACARPSVRAGRRRWCARRGRDPRSPAYLRRRRGPAASCAR